MPNNLMQVAARSVPGAEDAMRRVGEHLPDMPQNVNDAERWVSAAVGAALVGYGVSGKNISWLSTIAGGLLLARAATGHCSMYQAMGVSTCPTGAGKGQQGQGRNTVIPAGDGVKVEHAVVVNKSPGELYGYWRKFENLPKIMRNLESVTTQGGNGTRSHWVAKGPAGVSVSWDAEVTNDVHNELIAWKSLPGADVDNAGSVHFRPVAGGTEVRVSLKYNPPAGKVGAAVAKLFGRDPGTEVRDDLENFKKSMESGAGNTGNTAGALAGRR